MKNSRLDFFVLSGMVEYFYENNPNLVRTDSATFKKRITVAITSPLMPKNVHGNAFPLALRDLAIIESTSEVWYSLV